MSLPSSHTKRLHVELRGHEERLVFLQDQISHMSAEAAAHETIIQLGRNDRIMRALGDIAHRSGAIALMREQLQGGVEHLPPAALRLLLSLHDLAG